MSTNYYLNLVDISDHHSNGLCKDIKLSLHIGKRVAQGFIIDNSSGLFADVGSIISTYEKMNKDIYNEYGEEISLSELMDLMAPIFRVETRPFS